MIAGLPYDCEIEYLESTGTQYINTGYKSTGIGLGVSVRCAKTTTSTAETGIVASAAQFAFDIYVTYNICIWDGGINTLNSYIPMTQYDIFDIYGSMSNTGLTLTVNGKNFSRTGTPTIVAASDILLFSYRYIYKFIGRIYSCKIYDNGNLVRDFIPVRVGQTGYMYDRVSKRLFGNKGTGSFVLGPDVAKPVMGLWGMRKFYNARDYVQDGLVGLWDGIENVGWGAHSVTTQQWVDLTGNEQPIVPSYTGTGQGFSWTGTYLYNFIYEARQNSGVARDYSLNGMTVEWVMRDLMKWRDAFLVPTGFQANNYYVYKAFGTSGNAMSKSNVYNLVQAARSLSICVPPAGVGIAYLNGGATNMATNNSAKLLPLSGTGRIIFGSGSGNTHNAPVYAIRIYNRAITASEIAHNYTIDKARFNLP